MADYATRTVTTVREEVTLKSPTNWTEIAKALAYVRNQRPDGGQEYDDTVMVTATDGEIVFSWIPERP
jgi:hypothetical protein